MSDVTRILNQIESGDSTGAEQLPPLVDEELRRLAAQRLAAQRLAAPASGSGTPRPEAAKRPRFPVARLLLSQSLSDHADKHDGQLEFVRSLSSGKRVWNCLKARAARLPDEEIKHILTWIRSLGTPNSSRGSSGSHLRGAWHPRIRPGSLRGGTWSDFDAVPSCLKTMAIRQLLKLVTPLPTQPPPSTP